MGKIKSYITKSSKLLNYDFSKLENKQNEIEEKIENLNESNIESYKSIIELNYKMEEENKKLHKIRTEIADINELSNKTIENLEKLLKNNIDMYNKFKYYNIDGIQINCNNEKKHKVLICGFFGAKNLGDELMLQTMMREINKVGNFRITVMLCDNPEIDITQYEKCEFIHYPTNVMDYNKLAIEYDSLIFSGGALLDDIDYESKNEITLGKILVNLSMRFITFEKRVMLYGLSTNSELKNKEFIEKLNYIVNNSTYFSLRDINSLEVLKKSKINVEKVKIVEDIVWANVFNKVTINEEKNVKKVKIGISYVDYNNNIEELIQLTRNIYKYLDNRRSKLRS